MPEFQLITAIAAPPSLVFDTCLDVDTHLASMANSREKVIDGVMSGSLKLGDMMTLEAKHLGIRWRMQVSITEYEAPLRFVDEQIHGPFKYWHHTHTFTPDNHGGTVMGDTIDFAAPLGPLGFIAALGLKRYIRNLIRSRNEHIKARTEATHKES